jgi:hypothetical protein
MSAPVRLSRRACLVSVLLTIHPASLFAEGQLVPPDPETPSHGAQLFAQNTPPWQPVEPSGQPVTEATVELLYGVWHADIAAMVQSEASSMTPEELAMMTALLANLEVRFAFTASGQAGMAMSGMGEPESEPGTWQLMEVTGNQIRFTVVSRDFDTGELDTETFTATFVTTDYMTMTKPDDPQVIAFWRGADEDPDAFVSSLTTFASPEAGSDEADVTPPGSGLVTPSVGLTNPNATDSGQTGVADAVTPLQPVPVTGLPVVLAQPSNLHGVWRADIASMLAAEAASMAPEELAMMQALMGSMSIDFEFRPDGTARMSMSGMGQAETKTGTWRLLSITGSSIQFELIETPALGTAPSPELFTAAFDSTNNMSLTKDGDPQVIPFYRR